MDKTDKIGHGVIGFILILFMCFLYIAGYRDGQKDALQNKWKYEIDTTKIEINRIRK